MQFAIKTILLAAPVALVPTASAQTALRLPHQDCAKLVAHRPAPDVAYRPGVDVHGRPVAPADLPGSRAGVDIAKSVEFNLSFNPLADDGRTGGSTRRFARSELVLGRVSFDRETGEVRLNGRRLNAAEQSEIADKCRRALEKSGRPGDSIPR